MKVRFADPEQTLGVGDFAPGLDRAVLDWPGVGAFLIANGETITVRPSPGATDQELALVTGGAVLALLLEQRGRIVLHGSCVAINGCGAAFLGPSGAGKSTIAATLRDRGHSLVSDGMTVVDVSGAEPLALPGPPHLKLWPDAVQSLSGVRGDSRPLPSQLEKRWYHAADLLAVEPVPLRKAFLLTAGGGVSSRSLGPAAGLIGFVKNYFLADFITPASHAFVLRRCEPLARFVSVSVLDRGQALRDLPEVVVRLCGAA